MTLIEIAEFFTEINPYGVTFSWSKPTPVLKGKYLEYSFSKDDRYKFKAHTKNENVGLALLKGENVSDFFKLYGGKYIIYLVGKVYHSLYIPKDEIEFEIEKMIRDKNDNL